MYERNAIVLERYFYKIFDFKSSSNLRENYYNYRKLFECYGNLCNAKEKENICQEEFDIVSKEVSKIQSTQEKLYNKGAKFEYSRYVIFNNIKETTDNIEKHLQKVNEDVDKNSNELKELGQKFVETVIDYNVKEANLKEATAQRENAQKEYDEAYSKAKECYTEITEEKIDSVKNFINSDNKENKKELQAIFEDNGKKEKNQFDQDVISNTITKSFEIYKNEMDVYLAGYDRIEKLFEEIEIDGVKTDKHTKYYRDSKAKVDFLSAEKEYIVQFLDNERIGAIYDKKTHRKLMLEACKKFVLDFAQIANLYEIILKEAASRSTKKIYKENYKKEYLIELENSSVEPSLDTGKMRQEAIAFVNLNYWRVEGMRNVYDAFEKVVTTIYEKDLSEFIPEELQQKEEVLPEEPEKVYEEAEIKEEEYIAKEVIEKVPPRRVYYSSKISLANAIYHSLQTREFATYEEVEVPEESEESIIQEEQYSVPDTVKELLANIEEEPVQVEEPQISEENVENFETEPLEFEMPQEESIKEEINIEEKTETNFDLSLLDEIEINEIQEKVPEIELPPIVEEAVEETEDEMEYEEDSILDAYINDEKNKKEEEKKNTTETIKKKASFFRKLVGLNAKEKKKA